MNGIKERRIELGYTQPEISAYLRKVDARMDVGMVSRFENGVCLPTEKVADALCTILQATKAQLWGEEKTQEMQRKSAEQKAIVELISRTVPFGRENAIKRADLSRVLQVDDRKARHYIGIARLNGVIIINEQGGDGYFQSDDVKDIMRQYKQETNRAMTILSRRKAIRNRLKEAGVEV
jgi:transcriptional regulator with XRE-family HTH domain